ncbi:MAG: YraN family protein [Desulfitobacteriaceae bacterium]|nr:YraN family protein [Desulfitobacteriaceae bacterium]MDI6880909.1 YraN family protein [Desulfitobacteriaceae bacterium]MDI6913697.1 YraN family protein [Desulfitobacteriaceae bacterium]
MKDGSLGKRKRSLGLAGEAFAARFLAEAKLEILERNYRCSLGEIDIIAQDGEILVFVEVRSRSSGRLGWGEESVTLRKQQKLKQVADYYLKGMGYRNYPALRFDVVAVHWEHGEPLARWLKGAL